MADTTGDRVPELIVAAGRGAAPHVRVFDGRADAELMSFYACSPSFTGGVHVAAADLDGDGKRVRRAVSEGFQGVNGLQRLRSKTRPTCTSGGCRRLQQEELTRQPAAIRGTGLVSATTRWP
jgi:hypothetical protein